MSWLACTSPFLPAFCHTMTWFLAYTFFVCFFFSTLPAFLNFFPLQYIMILWTKFPALPAYLFLAFTPAFFVTVNSALNLLVLSVSHAFDLKPWHTKLLSVTECNYDSKRQLWVQFWINTSSSSQTCFPTRSCANRSISFFDTLVQMKDVSMPQPKCSVDHTFL